MATLAVLEVAPAITDGAWLPLDADVTVKSTGLSYESVLECDCTVEGVVDGVRPRGSTQIVLPFKVTYNGTELPYWKRLPGMTVEETIAGPTFSFDVPLRGDYPSEFSDPLGTAAAFLGPPGGKRTLHVDARFVEGGSVRTVRLVTNGLVDNSSARVGSGDVRTINGVGARGRYDRALATYTLSPGHGLARNSVVRNVLLAADIPTASVALGGGGRRCYKGVQLVDQGALAFADEYLKPALLQISENRAGQFVTVPLAPTGSETPQFTFTEQDLLRASAVNEGTSADGPTCVRVTGTKQITRDDEGLRTDVKVVETYGAVPPQQATQIQDGAGTLSAVTPVSYPTDQLFLLSRVTYEQEYAGDTLLSERVTTEGRYNPQAWRYTLDSTGSISGYQSGVYLYDSSAISDDGALAYVFKSERFGMTAQVTTRYLYDDRGFLTEQVTETSRYVLRYAALKSRNAMTLAWEDDDFNDPVRVIGSGDGVAENEGFIGPVVVVPIGVLGGVEREVMTYPLYRSYDVFSSHGPADRDTIAYRVSDDGYILGESSTRETYNAGPGAYELYLTGEFGETPWSLQESEVVDTTYMASVEGSHTIITATTDIQGNTQTTVEYGQGHLPAAERSLDMVDPDWATEFGEDDLLYTRAASRFESQPIKVELCSNALESFREHYEELVTDDWAEDVDELTNIAEYHIRAGCVAEVSFGLPFNPLVRPATAVHLSLPTVGWEKDIWVTSVRHTEGQGETTTEVTGEEWLL